MRKRKLLATALTLAFTLVSTSLSVLAAEPAVEGNYLDDFERTEVAVNGENNTLSDGTSIYWNGAGAGTFSISDGVLNAKMNEGGYYRFATNNDKTYKYVVIRIKGDERAVNDKIYVRIGPAEKGAIDDNAERGDKSLAQLKTPNGEAVPAVSTEWQDIVIDVEKSGFSLGGGSNGFQIGTWQAMNLDIDYIFMTNVNPSAPGETSTEPATPEEPATPAEPAAPATPAETTSPAPTKVTNPEDIITGALIDNFNRAELPLSNTKLSDGTTVYWNQSGAGTFTISNGILHAKMNDGGFYRLATNNTESFKYVVIRIKGDQRAVNEKIYTRIGVAERGDIDDNSARGDKSFADIKGPDGKPVPKITSSWQNIVIDLEKSGFALGGGSNAFQIGSWQPMDLDIDFIYMTNTLPNPSTGDTFPAAAAVAALASAAALVILTRKKAQQQ
ncbi:hypothetical protein [Clostridium thermarum]|uniref:hypothetical protein n=1 Tax=Clostridium thermarum TaxID=1716543 RepID=UPI0013D8A47F|nr:hypothetical protein [Clostridium thermarum]